MKHYLLSTTNQNELAHYGVIGMKWGIRRYQNKDGTLTEAGKKKYGDSTPDHMYTSWGTKHNRKKAEKARAKGNEAKAKEFDRRAKRSEELDRREEAYAKSVKSGANLALRVLTVGTIGGKGYQRFLAMLGGTEDGTNGPTLKKLAAFTANNLLGGPIAASIGSSIVKAIYLRSGNRNES